MSEEAWADSVVGWVVREKEKSRVTPRFLSLHE